MRTVLIFAGTRPEVIKLAPVYFALRRRMDFSVHFIATGQHREMLQTALKDFDITPEASLDVMRDGQGLAQVSARLFSGIDDVLAQYSPDFALVQGDTMTTMVAALCAFYRHIPYGHVEAGLRSGDLAAPFPEELNRRVTSLAASLHFAPTSIARDALLKEHVPPDSIKVTGNTAIDALFLMLAKLRDSPPDMPPDVASALESGRKIVLLTAHRRENLETGIASICEAVNRLAERFPNVVFLFPVHLNPGVRHTVASVLTDRENIITCPPFSYAQFVYAMHKAYMLLSDSGGVQEEAPAMDKPVLILREVTERPEGVTAGCSRLVGTNRDRIIEAVSTLLCDSNAYESMASAPCPYGDGNASERIAECVENFLSGCLT